MLPRDLIDFFQIGWEILQMAWTSQSARRPQRAKAVSHRRAERLRECELIVAAVHRLASPPKVV